MNNSYKELPTDYKQVFVIDLLKNKKQFWIVNIGNLILIIPFFVLYYFFERSISISDGLKFYYVLLLSLLITIPTVVLHELIHGIFFKIYGKDKLKFGFHGFAFSCSMPTHYFSKKAYIKIGLAPLVIITIITVILSILLYNTDYFLLPYVSLAFNFSGAIGDLYVTYKLSKMNDSVYVRDFGIIMRFFDTEEKKAF